MYRETRIRHSSSECPHCGHSLGPAAAAAASSSPKGGMKSRSQSEDTSSSNTIDHHPYCGKRKYSMVKFGYHLAVPLAARRSGKPVMGVSTSASKNTPLVIALVGLPARGKTYISKKLSRYLNWIGINTRVFNLGEYRRKVAPQYNNADFFSSANAEGNKLRDKVCADALDDVIHWLDTDDGEVAVFDATNTTRKRRRLLYQRLVEENDFNLFFVESVCENQEIIEQNIREVKVNSPDYVNTGGEADVVKDFKARIKHYEEMYETLDDALEPDFSFLKIFNAGEKVLVHKHEGHIQSRIVYYLMNIHITQRTIYLTRHGESDFNLQGLTGGDSHLSERGIRFSQQLAQFVETLNHPKLKVWTSWLKRTIETTTHISGVQERWKALNEIDSGLCDSLTYAEIKEQFPDDFVARDDSKFTYRYPRGESYEDLVARLEPVIMEMERQDSVLVVAHQAVLRCLLAYYLETTEDELPWLQVPLHTVVKLEPVAYGCKVQYIRFPIDCVSTHRKKPKRSGFLDSRLSRNIVLEERRESSPFKFSSDDFLSTLQISDHVVQDLDENEEDEIEVRMATPDAEANGH